MKNIKKNIAIDLGNSIAKIGVFQQGELVQKQQHTPFESLANVINHLRPHHVIISTVNQQVDKLVDQIDSSVIVLDHNTAIPITNKYATPKTLGKDRLASIVGAYTISSQTNTLVIDIGTCITYDVINTQNEYLGGSISPGIALKFKALHSFTAHLPLIEELETNTLVGNTTEKAILSGVINGTIAEIEEIIRMYKDKFSNLQIIICGGSAKSLSKKIKTKTKLVPDLVLLGLNRILEYNV